MKKVAKKFAWDSLVYFGVDGEGNKKFIEGVEVVWNKEEKVYEEVVK